MNTEKSKEKFSEDDFEWWVFENKTHNEILETFRTESEKRIWCKYFLNDNPFYPSNLNSKCRIGYVPFDNCIQNRFYYIDKSRDPEMVAAGGIVTQINWDYDINTLPQGWQGSVRTAYFDNLDRENEPNTLVALLAFTPNRYRGRGLSKIILSKMCSFAKEKGYCYFLVPALPPSQFELNYSKLSMKEISQLKRSDGSYYDFWLRLHAQKGAELIGYCETSHRFIYSINDFSKYVSSTPIEHTGEHLVQLDNDKNSGVNGNKMWETVFVDRERDFVTFNWGCIWMRYDINRILI